MALEATHIRFALDTQDVFEVEDLSKFISGTIYPDSRYPTGIDRTLTHDDSQMAKSFWGGNDFRKGWATHLLYDKLQFAVHTDWFGALLKGSDPQMTSEEDWIVRTALKILQDIDDVSHFDILPSVSALNYIETPNGEDTAKMYKYNQQLSTIYNKAPVVTIEDLELMWVDWGISAEIAAKMRNKAYEIQKSEYLMVMIEKIYDETVMRRDAFYNTYCV
jgi:hypothetical protein